MSQAPTTIETPVQIYHHPDTDARVDLVGTIHYGEPEYYQQIQGIIDDRIASGAVVHQELVKAASQAEYDAAPRRVRRSLDHLDAIGVSIDRLAKKAGLVSQIGALTVGEGWEQHDVSNDVVMARDLNPYALGTLALMMKIGTAMASIAPREVKRQVIVEALVAADAKPSRITGILQDGNMKSFLDDRNGVALLAADEHFAAHPGSEIVFPWGVEHISGLAAGFEDRGFHKVAEQSLIAIQL